MGTFLKGIVFCDIFKLSEDICCGIKIEDLQLVKDNHYPDNKIKEGLPENHKDWWCKVEDGYILNLNGKKKIKYLTTIIVD